MGCAFTRLQLRLTKTSDNRSTLLNYLAELVHEKCPDVFRIVDELAVCADAARGVFEV